MAESIDEITMEYVEDDKVLVKEIDKNILTRGSWTTIMFLFKELIKDSEDYGPLKVSIRRYQKRNGVFRQQSKFNISNGKQARAVSAALNKWFPADGDDFSEDQKEEG